QLQEVGIPEFYLAGRNRLMGSDAAFAFIDVLNDPRIDDSYVKLTFILDEPWIDIDPVSDKYIGDKFALKGTTNNAVDDTVLITITSATFVPTAKGTASEFAGSSYAVKVVKGTGDVNTWSQEVDTSTFKPDEYIINVEVIETGATSTGTFLVSEVPPTTIPTTAPPTTVPVTTAVTTAPPTTTVPPTTTPGFGAVIALIGLGAVAVLVLRRH
ncbi:MAG: PGF-CTERM sorting domain-containing protein, partial [Methanomicrobiales archaeon]|nr:PGF-CTERM sorting domain-containing protein [Methanomicrobiales archaeon]